MTTDIARALDALVPGCEYRVTEMIILRLIGLLQT